MIVIGGGVAGLMAALAAAPRPVTLINSNGFGLGAASWLAQGGVAAAIGHDDSLELHAADTLAVGAGLCNPEAVRRIISSGPDIIQKFIDYGVVFDNAPDGALSLGLEAAHSRHRILHGGGDQTGAVIMRALIEKVMMTPSVSVLEATARRIFVGDAGVSGVQITKNGEITNLVSDRVLLATGGIGGLFRYSTNPLGALGHGLILAKDAGALLENLEFVQFHPTALSVDVAPLPLISEAVRGEGARFIDEQGVFFMEGKDLDSRDVVARGVFAHTLKGHKVFLDARSLREKFSTRFPAIYAVCMKAGIDPALQPLPVQPAAHYHMGGIGVDEYGRTTIKGLYAAGEVACTGLHGANRLASNSLLEAAVCGTATGLAMKEQAAKRDKALPMLALPPEPKPEAVKDIMSRQCGVVRTTQGLEEAANKFSDLARTNPAADLSLAIVQAALARTESIGAHARDDHLIQQAA
ncbi:L-aspartate oxidase [Acidocella sp.]|uniref:L-aspartate oxidase n=1 Tax=Acidocella sp. TaxID=50710 RepID=UPI003CFC2327